MVYGASWQNKTKKEDSKLSVATDRSTELNVVSKDLGLHSPDVGSGRYVPSPSGTQTTLYLNLGTRRPREVGGRLILIQSRR